MRHIVALSGGKDSTAMALRLAEVEPQNYEYICTPTSNELPAMFEHWSHLASLLGSPIVPVTAGTLESCIDDNGAIPNSRMRFCTRQLKIEPMQAFLLSVAPCVSYVGLRADEADREGAIYQSDQIIVRHPLREWGWGLCEVQSYLKERGVSIPERTDCAWCFFQRLGEWWMLWRDHPSSFSEAEEIESRIGHTFRSPSRDTWPAALRDLRKRFEAGDKPEISLRMMETRKEMCGICAR